MHVPFLPPRLWRVPLPNSQGDFASATLRPPGRKPMPLLRTYHRYHRHTGIVFLSSAPFGYLLAQPSSYLAASTLPATTPLSRKAPEPPEEGKIHITPRAICLLPSSGNSSHTSCPPLMASLPSGQPCPAGWHRVPPLCSGTPYHPNILYRKLYILFADMPPSGQHACSCRLHVPDTLFASCSGKCNRKKAACQGEKAYLDKLPPSDYWVIKQESKRVLRSPSIS